MRAKSGKFQQDDKRKNQACVSMRKREGEINLPKSVMDNCFQEDHSAIWKENSLNSFLLLWFRDLRNTVDIKTTVIQLQYGRKKNEMFELKLFRLLYIASAKQVGKKQKPR